jgi:ATP-binding cassette subfamily B protein
MKLLLNYLRGHWKLCVLVVAIATINQVANLLDPLVFQRIVDTYIMNYSDYTLAEFTRGVVGLLLASVGIVLIARIAKNLQDYYLNTVVQRVGARLYTDGIEQSLQLPFESFENERSGGILNTLQKTRTDVEKFIGSAINTAFISLVGFVFVCVYAFIVHPIIGTMFLSIAPLVAGISYALSRRVKAIQTQIVAQSSALAGSTTESLRNIELIKSLGLEQQEISQLNATTDKILDLELQKLRYIRSVSFVQGTVVNLLRTGIIATMLLMVWHETMTFGQVWTLLIYSFYVFTPLQDLGTVFAHYSESSASLAKFREILEKPREVIPAHGTVLGAIETIRFENVAFQYASAAQSALMGVSFEMKRGQTVAFVGPSGSGKTSLVKLLVGLYQPIEGRIMYNDIAGTEIIPDSLRSQIGFVTQETQLFAGTIRENMLFVCPHATDDQITDSLRRSACGPLLDRAESGLDTTIGEGGMKLSGGERQRLSIARALLRNPGILVFDEATSSLDSITEEEITNTIREIGQDLPLTPSSNFAEASQDKQRGQQDHITVLIAHRLSTIMHADVIHVLEKSHIIESGTHDALLAEKGLYYAMWRQQVGERV